MSNYKERFKEAAIATRNYFLYFAYWLVAAAIMGVVGGFVGTAFSKTLVFVTGLREENGVFLYFLPMAGLAIAGIYQLMRVNRMGTNAVFETVRDEKTVPVLLAPAVFISTAITHLFGGSAGREGAALQMGGSLANLLGRILHVEQKNKHIFTMCGMAALFSALFGTPVGACIFAVEVASVGRLYTAAFFPCIVSSSVAHLTATLCGEIPEHYEVGAVPNLSAQSLLHTLVIGVCVAVAAIIFCKSMHGVHHAFQRFFPNRYLRVAVGGAMIVGLSLIFDSGIYNGSGSHIIEGIFEGERFGAEVFLVKILFTAITMGCGFKGGEIVPTLSVGAALGATVAALLGESVPFGAAVGMAALFSGVTNCPLTAILLGVELFGADGAVYYLLAVLTSYLLSGRFSLYSGQKIIYSRLDDHKFKDKKA